jgi:2,3-bisphosphoglycerate-independent phosphoglycerate mutase
MSETPICLVVLDGWGIAEPGPGNAVDLAHTPVFDGLWSDWPHTKLAASGRAVGLPDGQMGNSEVGHTNLGAGRVVRQDLVRIDEDIETGAFAQNPAFLAAFERARGSALHLVGLLSDGGVHSHISHLQALIAAAGAAGVERVYVHAFTDGRDVSPTSGAGFAEQIPGIVTISGRYWAMDRDRRWDRVKRAYDAIVHGQGEFAGSAVAALRAAYAAGVTDEFIPPTVIGDPRVGRIHADDAVIFFNFRPDRARELTRSLIEPGFDEFDRGQDPPRPYFVQMTEYSEEFAAPIAYPPESLTEVLADVLAAEGIGQLHVAETEKYPHVTYFFDGGSEHLRAGEEWSLVDSPRDVATYDLAPAMSAVAITDVLCERLAEGGLGFLLINFANPDMVGHTGVISAAVEAVEVADSCLGRVLAAVEAAGGVTLVTADHGNAEEMLAADGSPQTAHTTNPVPLVLTKHGVTLRNDGRLADIAPTVLSLLGVAIPVSMTGRSLIV